MATKSIITCDMEHCAVCQSSFVEIHHIVFGTANRDLSDKFGLVVPLCEKHHRTGKNAVHRDRNADLFWTRLAERRFKEVWKEYDFLEVFGKDWIDE